jgi:hypothetical protein
LQEASTEKKKKCFLFQNKSPVRQQLSGEKPFSIPPLEGTKIRSTDRGRSFHAFYRLIQLTRKKKHTYTQPRIDFSRRKTEPNDNKKRQKTNTPRKSKSRVKNSPIYFPQPRPLKIPHTATNKQTNKQTKQNK